MNAKSSQRPFIRSLSLQWFVPLGKRLTTCIHGNVSFPGICYFQINLPTVQCLESCVYRQFMMPQLHNSSVFLIWAYIWLLGWSVGRLGSFCLDSLSSCGVASLWFESLVWKTCLSKINDYRFSGLRRSGSPSAARAGTGMWSAVCMFVSAWLRSETRAPTKSPDTSGLRSLHLICTDVSDLHPPAPP